MAPAAKDRADQGRRLSRLLCWTWRFSGSLSGSGEDMTARGQNLAGSVAIPSGLVWISRNPLTGGLATNSARLGPDNVDGRIAGNCQESAGMDRRRPRKQGLAQQMRPEYPPAGGHNSDGPESSNARLHPANHSRTVSSRDRASPSTCLASVSRRPLLGSLRSVRRGEPWHTSRR